MSGTSAVTSTIAASDWRNLTVDAPEYGESATNNEFYCENQCTALIGQYLYIVGPYSSSSSNTHAVREHIYRLDLGASPPEFSQESVLPSLSSIGYTAQATQHCVTAVDGILYILTGGVGQTYSLEGVKYDPNTNTQTDLSKMPSTDSTALAGRQNAGCAGGVAGNNIYLLGGKTNRNIRGAPGVDTYDLTNSVWTENSQTNEFDTSNGVTTNSRYRMSCFNRYSHTVECVGGYGQDGNTVKAMDNAIVWNYDDRSEEEVALALGVFNAGVALYEIMNDGIHNKAATVVLVTGGITDVNTNAVTDAVQYAVRHVTLTSEPSASPVASPSAAPTPMPSRSPLCADCTHPPSPAPTTTPAPVESGTSSSERWTVKVWTVVSFMIVMISAVVYV